MICALIQNLKSKIQNFYNAAVVKVLKVLKVSKIPKILNDMCSNPKFKI